MNDDEKIEINSFYEILQDNYTIVILAKILSCFENIESRNAIEEFIADFSPVLIHEAYIFLKDKKLVSDENFYKSEELKKKVAEYRMLTTKKKVKKSEYIKSIKDNMEIDLEDDTFDINVIVLDNMLKRFNFSEFNKRKEKDFLNMCYSTNTVFSEIIFKNIMISFSEEDYRKTLDIFAEEWENEIKDLEVVLSGIRYSYRSSKLFSKTDITEVDKYFILYRLNMISILIELEKFFRKARLTITSSNMIICDVYKFISKMIALEIEIIGNDIRYMDTTFSKSLIKKLDEELLNKNNEFYPLNRRLRNNIHYENIDVINDKEYNEIIELQRKYLNIVYEEVEEQIFIDIGEEEIMLTEFYNYCNKNNIEQEEIDNNYENYYTQYYYTKNINRNLPLN